jgi:hypothetical protein
MTIVFESSYCNVYGTGYQLRYVYRNNGSGIAVEYITGTSNLLSNLRSSQSAPTLTTRHHTQHDSVGFCVGDWWNTGCRVYRRSISFWTQVGRVCRWSSLSVIDKSWFFVQNLVVVFSTSVSFQLRACIHKINLGATVFGIFLFSSLGCIHQIQVLVLFSITWLYPSD